MMSREKENYKLCHVFVNTVPRESINHSVIPRPPNQQNLKCIIIIIIIIITIII
jgi:hypothetical protein